jgi:hypothetical protein
VDGPTPATSRTDVDDGDHPRCYLEQILGKLSHKIFREIIRERERQGRELESEAAAASSTCCGTSSG